MIPVRVGPYAETFPVHKAILRKSEYFRKALDGGFREAGDQAIDLPEEDPDIFSFVVAYLYEEKFSPIRALSTALGSQFSIIAQSKFSRLLSCRPRQRKGKGNQ